MGSQVKGLSGCGLRRNKLCSGHGIVPELAFGVKAAEQCPDNDPARGDDGQFTQTELKYWVHHQWRQNPYPGPRVPPKCANLCDGLAMAIYNTDVPSLHGKRLSASPKPGAVDANDHDNKPKEQVGVLHRMASAAQQAKYESRSKNNTDQKHAFVEPAGHPAPKPRGFQFGVHGLGQSALRIVGARPFPKAAGHPHFSGRLIGRHGVDGDGRNAVNGCRSVRGGWRLAAGSGRGQFG